MIILGYILTFLLAGIIFSQLQLFKVKRFFRIITYVIASVFSLIVSLVLIDTFGSNDIVNSNMVGEIGGKFAHIGAISFYLGTLGTANNKTDRSKILKYIIGGIALLGALTQFMALTLINNSLDNSFVSNILSVRAVFLVIFSISLFFSIPIQNFVKTLKN